MPDLEGCLVKLHPLITTLRERARESCHRANQLLLLRDMLETRQCSHLLLPESLSEAWVENVVHKRILTALTVRVEIFSLQSKIILSIKVLKHFHL